MRYSADTHSSACSMMGVPSVLYAWQFIRIRRMSKSRDSICVGRDGEGIGRVRGKGLMEGEEGLG